MTQGLQSTDNFSCVSYNFETNPVKTQHKKFPRLYVINVIYSNDTLDHRVLFIPVNSAEKHAEILEMF